MSISVLQLTVFTVWLAMEIIGVTLTLVGYTTAGWSILGVFTSIAILVAIGVNLYMACGKGVGSNLPELVDTRAATVKPVTVPADNSAKAFVLNLEEAGAV